MQVATTDVYWTERRRSRTRGLCRFFSVQLSTCVGDGRSPCAGLDRLSRVMLSIIVLRHAPSVCGDRQTMQLVPLSMSTSSLSPTQFRVLRRMSAVWRLPTVVTFVVVIMAYTVTHVRFAEINERIHLMHFSPSITFTGRSQTRRYYYVNLCAPTHWQNVHIQKYSSRKTNTE